MIIVFGSINMDVNITVPHLPHTGETVLSNTYLMTPGGKGANQALAAARLDERVSLIGKIGDDGMGVRALHSLRRAAVSTVGVGESESLPTGCAIIARDQHGQNNIIVATGANYDVTNDQAPDEVLVPGNILLLQMEVPVPEIEKIVDRAYARGVKIVMNFSPVTKISVDTLKKINILIVNEYESRQTHEMLGMPLATTCAQQAQDLSKTLESTVIITLGDKGSLAYTTEQTLIQVPALEIDKVVDSTGAGDAYCGTLVASLHKKNTLEDAMRWGAVAGSLACKTAGAQDSFVYMDEIKNHLPMLDSLPAHT
jgi:ribokinase